MSDYQDSFYERYEREFIMCPTVRKAHDWIFSIVSRADEFRSVLDLGCGRSQEFRRFVRPLQYIGLDLNPGKQPYVQPADYRQITEAHVPKWATAFVSLFSTEITAPAEENLRLYERMFSFHNIRAGLVSGFYYAGWEHENPIAEAGGVTSFQTVDPLRPDSSNVYEEARIVVPVPSMMFGPNVVEVWKFLRKK